MKGLVLRFDAPIMSFGGVIVDNHGYTDRFPSVSMVTGLLANALGWRHRDVGRLQQLQDRLALAARWDEPFRLERDYQTVDLGQPKMSLGGWTTRGEPEGRGKSPNAKATHIRYRDYLVDGLMTLVVAVKGAGQPDLPTIEHALRRPARPLFLGRKSCLPAGPILDRRIPVAEGVDVLDVLRQVPLQRRSLHADTPRAVRLRACWPADLGVPPGSQVTRSAELRDWANQVHVGDRLRVEGFIEVSSA